MGFNDHYPEDAIQHDVICNLCGKRFRFMTEDQIPGFREMSILTCPHCGAELGRSMDIEYNNIRKLED